MSKDFIRFRQYLRSQNLSVNEQFLLEYLFELHNDEFGYAYPPFNDIAEAFNTTSRNRVSSVIKSLEKKGLLTVDRNYKNNRYFITEIQKFIDNNKNVTKKKEKVKDTQQDLQARPKDSDGNIVLEGQVHVSELEKRELNYIEQNDIEYIANELNISIKQALKLYLEANKKINKVLEVYEYSKTQNVSKLVPYLMKLIKVFKPKPKIKELGFRNFTEREYDWTELEQGLLGW